jgi:hypothetical protein
MAELAKALAALPPDRLAAVLALARAASGEDKP